MILFYRLWLFQFRFVRYRVFGALRQQYCANCAVYDVWGDAVNLASRMESSGERGQVNVSESTYQRIKDFFEMEHRGQVMAKNKGAVDMYFVKRILPALSQDGEGLQPNERFREMYNVRNVDGSATQNSNTGRK